MATFEKPTCPALDALREKAGKIASTPTKYDKTMGRQPNGKLGSGGAPITKRITVKERG
jgi:hypothetical protein